VILCGATEENKMRIWKRYAIILSLVACLTIFTTFFIFKHVRHKYGNKRLGLVSNIFSDTMEFNRNPKAIFYDLYKKSSLYSRLKDVDRATLTDERVEHILEDGVVMDHAKSYQINVAFSDLIPINRPVPDSRPSGSVFFQLFQTI